MHISGLLVKISQIESVLTNAALLVRGFFFQAWEIGGGRWLRGWRPFFESISLQRQVRAARLKPSGSDKPNRLCLDKRCFISSGIFSKTGRQAGGWGGGRPFFESSSLQRQGRAAHGCVAQSKTTGLK